MKCHYKECKEQPLTSSDARVEIKTVLPPGWADSESSKASAVVQWRRSGEARFHKSCWKTVLSTARQEGETTMKQSEKLMVQQASKTAERFDSLDEVSSAAKAVAGLIQKSRHCIAFTGAGISTSAGLGDFRGKSGKWTEQDRSQATGSIKAAFAAEGASGSKPSSKKAQAAGADDGDSEEEEAVKVKKFVGYENLRPTYTHESLVLLLEKGLLHHIISQNCDGLHLLSGVPAENLSQLHGDVFVEKCEKCGKRYTRNFYVSDSTASQYFKAVAHNRKTTMKKPDHAVRCSYCGLCHRTGRLCEQKDCGGYLMNTIINFSDHLEGEILYRAEMEASRSDLILCLGTTLMVTPAADLVDTEKGRRSLIICNRQDTAKDRQAKVRVYGDCDGFMKQVIHHLLSSDELQAWEGKRDERLEKYTEQRATKKRQA